MNSNWIKADWPAPDFIKAGTTTRQRGKSTAPYASFNLATHVGDNLESVIQNRNQVRTGLSLSNQPQWLEQIHSTKVVLLPTNESLPKADAAYTTQKSVVCAVMTADCLPLLVTDTKGTCVAAIHAGWRGLADGIIASTVKKLPVKSELLLVWLGPAIGPEVYEVGEEVYDAFTRMDEEAKQAFKPVIKPASAKQHWLFDIYSMAKLQLGRLGIANVYGGNFCTFNEKEKFYSYRRDGVTGRMASLIWIDKN